MTYLKLAPGTIEPLGVVAHPISIRKRLDPHLYFTRVVQDATISVHMVNYRREVVVFGGVVENRVVPSIEIRIAGDQLWKGSPLVRRSDEPGTICTNGGWGRIRRLKIVLRPGQFRVRTVESWFSIDSGIGLMHSVRNGSSLSIRDSPTVEGYTGIK